MEPTLGKWDLLSQTYDPDYLGDPIKKLQKMTRDRQSPSLYDKPEWQPPKGLDAWDEPIGGTAGKLGKVPKFPAFPEGHKFWRSVQDKYPFFERFNGYPRWDNPFYQEIDIDGNKVPVSSGWDDIRYLEHATRGGWRERDETRQWLELVKESRDEAYDEKGFLKIRKGDDLLSESAADFAGYMESVHIPLADVLPPKFAGNATKQSRSQWIDTLRGFFSGSEMDDRIRRKISSENNISMEDVAYHDIDKRLRKEVRKRLNAMDSRKDKDMDWWGTNVDAIDFFIDLDHFERADRWPKKGKK